MLIRRGHAVALVALAALLPACQAILGIDTLSGPGSACPDHPSVELCATADVDENCDGKLKCTGDAAFTVEAVTEAGGVLAAAVAADASGRLWATGTTAGELRIGDKSVKAPISATAFLVRLSTAGEPEVVTLFDGDDTSNGYNIAALPSGDVAVVGEFSGKLTFGADTLQSIGYGGFVAVFDGDGKPKWARQFAGTSMADPAEGSVTDVAVDPDGNVVVCGGLQGTFKGPSGETIAAKGGDILLARFDASGNAQVIKTLGGPGRQRCDWLAVDAEGGVAIEGDYDGVAWQFGTNVAASQFYASPFVGRLSADFAPRWGFGFVGSSAAYPSGVGVDPTTKDVIVGGDFIGTIDLGPGPEATHGSRDVFVSTFSDAGKPLKAVHFGDKSYQALLELRVDPAGQILLTGDFDGTLDFGGCTLVSSGGPDPGHQNDLQDAYVAKLLPSLEPAWCKRGGSPDDAETGLAVASDPLGYVVAAGVFHSSFVFDGGKKLTCGSNCNPALYFTRLDP